MFSKQDIEKYFVAEKQLGLLFVIVAGLAFVLSIIFLLFIKTPFYTGAAIPLLVIGLLQMAVGFAVFRKSDKDRTRLVSAYDINRSVLQKEELPRMRKVLQNFSRVKWLEAALIITGLLLIFFYRHDADRAFWYGFGLTLTLQVLLTLVADYSAERRAQQYTRRLQNFLSAQAD